MKISVIVEGKTEKAFIPALRKYLETSLTGNMPNLDLLPYNGRIPTGDKLKRVVANLLEDSKNPSNYVIALTDVYTGNNDFIDATDAKNKMRGWVQDQRFIPHAAQYDFEAWLLPYWSSIQKLSGSNRTVPQGNPEAVNHNNPPCHRISEVFRNGSNGRYYNKPRDAGRILRDNGLSVAISSCSELKAFVNTILTICGVPKIY
jgi:hypothetical protein